jgi:CyaY protein
MDEARFDKLAGDELTALEALLRDQDGLEADLANGILTLEMEDGGPNIIINSHAAARQIWVAANLSAAHFGYDEKTSRWFDTRTGEELRQRLGSLISDRVGRKVTL